MNSSELERKYCIVETIAELSPRQREVLILIIQGYRNKEIALKLGIAQQTVSEYLRRAKVRIAHEERG